MYKLFTANSKTEKILREYINSREDIKKKLKRISTTKKETGNMDK